MFYKDLKSFNGNEDNGKEKLNMDFTFSRNDLDNISIPYLNQLQGLRLNCFQ